MRLCWSHSEDKQCNSRKQQTKFSLCGAKWKFLICINDRTEVCSQFCNLIEVKLEWVNWFNSQSRFKVQIYHFVLKYKLFLFSQCRDKSSWYLHKSGHNKPRACFHQQRQEGDDFYFLWSFNIWTQNESWINKTAKCARRAGVWTQRVRLFLLCVVFLFSLFVRMRHINPHLCERAAGCVSSAVSAKMLWSRLKNTEVEITSQIQHSLDHEPGKATGNSKRYKVMITATVRFNMEPCNTMWREWRSLSGMICFYLSKSFNTRLPEICSNLKYFVEWKSVVCVILAPFFQEEFESAVRCAAVKRLERVRNREHKLHLSLTLHLNYKTQLQMQNKQLILQTLYLMRQEFSSSQTSLKHSADINENFFLETLN